MTQTAVVSDLIQLDESHGASGTAQKLNWLRAGVLGANDGIVSVAAVVAGVAGATADLGAIATAGAAAVLGGALALLVTYLVGAFLGTSVGA